MNMNMQPEDGMGAETMTQVLLQRLDEINRTLTSMQAEAARAAAAAAVARDTVNEMSRQVKAIMGRLGALEEPESGQ